VQNGDPWSEIKRVSQEIPSLEAGLEYIHEFENGEYSNLNLYVSNLIQLFKSINGEQDNDIEITKNDQFEKQKSNSQNN